jgi:ubiquinone/menaquinone biosynthesis C-methylase UbiE
MIHYLLRPFYYLLYHQFAWSYDFIAALVSLGRWQNWVNSTIPFLEGHILEIGYGPGHMQQILTEKNFSVFGLDESRQMAKQTSRRLRKNRIAPNILRGYAQHIPFANESFHSVVATFPSEYIFDPETLLEIRRVLTPGGRLVILPMAWITGTRLLERLAAWLFRITGEAPGVPGQISTMVKNRISHLGFAVRSEIIKLDGGQVLIVLANKG